MPQVTLQGYFKPIQPRLVSDLPYHQPRESVIAKGATDSSDALSIAEKQTSQLTVREAVAHQGLVHEALDLFVPNGQSQAAIVRVSSTHVARLKQITSTLLPVRYPDKFFNECLEDKAVADLSRVLLWNEHPVGWIRCRLEDDERGHKQIYVQALGVLAPYRGSGLATSLLAQVTQPSVIKKYSPTSIYCHVWQSNEDALEWYGKRGFKRVLLLDQYYRRLKPAGAWIMRKELA